MSLVNRYRIQYFSDDVGPGFTVASAYLCALCAGEQEDQQGATVTLLGPSDKPYCPSCSFPYAEGKVDLEKPF